jgi:LuxR family maltose regulon positive regulatory protein
LIAAQEPLILAIETGRAAGDAHITPLAVSGLAYLYVQRGRLRRAAALCRDALDLDDAYAPPARPPLPADGNTYGVLSEVLREWDKLEAAVRMAQEGVRLGRAWGQADTVTACSLHLAGALSEAGDLNGALEAVEQAKRVAGRVSPWFANIAALVEAEVHMNCGLVAPVARWAEKEGVLDEVRNLRGNRRTYTLVSKLLIAQGHWGEATQLLERLMRQCEELDAAGTLIEGLVLHAVALAAQGETAPALASLARALSLAAPEGYVRTFVRAGAPLGELLSQLLRGPASVLREGAAGYAAQLLAAVEGQAGRVSAVPLRQAPAQAPSPLIEPLSPREAEVLRFLRGPLSMPEIARELYVSVNTIRTHVKHIYAKLDVHARSEAVARAVDLGLL